MPHGYVYRMDLGECMGVEHRFAAANEFTPCYAKRAEARCIAHQPASAGFGYQRAVSTVRVRASAKTCITPRAPTPVALSNLLCYTPSALEADLVGCLCRRTPRSP